MHELAVCQALIAEVEALAISRQAQCVTAVHVEVGPLSGVEAELLKRAYPIATAGTVAEDAEFFVESAPVLVHCSRCHADSEATVNRLVCGACGDWRTSVISGDELFLASVEMITDITVH